MGNGERLKKTCEDLAEEAVRRGKISEKDTHAIVQLLKIRNLYENFIYSLDGSYTDECSEELLSLIDNPTALQEYYLNI